MKKIITFICALVAVIAVTSCDVESSTTIEFENLPKTVYEAKEYSQTELDALLAEITVKIDNTSVNLKDSRLNVTGFDLNTLKTPGDYTLIVKYDSASVAFGYSVVKKEQAQVVSTEEGLVAAVANGGIIELAGNIVLEKQIEITKSIVIYGKGYTLSTTKASRVLNVSEQSNLKVNIYNTNLISSGERSISLFGTNNVELTLENCKLESTYYTLNLASGNHGTIVSIKNCEIKGFAAINVWSNSSTINVEGGKLISTWDSVDEGFGVIVLNGGARDFDKIGLVAGETGQNNNINIKDVEIICENPETEVRALVIQDACANNTVNFDGVTLNCDPEMVYRPDNLVPAANKFYIDGVRQ